MQNVHLRTLVALDRALDTVLQGEGDFAEIYDAYRDLSRKTSQFTEQFQSSGKRSSNILYGAAGWEEFERTNVPIIKKSFADDFIEGMSTDDKLKFLSTVKSLTVIYLTTGTLDTDTEIRYLTKEFPTFTRYAELTDAITNECDTFFRSLNLPSYGFNIGLLRDHVNGRLKSPYALNIDDWKNIHPKFWTLAGA